MNKRKILSAVSIIFIILLTVFSLIFAFQIGPFAYLSLTLPLTLITGWAVIAFSWYKKVKKKRTHPLNPITALLIGTGIGVMGIYSYSWLAGLILAGFYGIIWLEKKNLQLKMPEKKTLSFKESNKFFFYNAGSILITSSIIIWLAKGWLSLIFFLLPSIFIGSVILFLLLSLGILLLKILLFFCKS